MKLLFSALFLLPAVVWGDVGRPSFMDFADNVFYTEVDVNDQKSYDFSLHCQDETEFGSSPSYEVYEFDEPKKIGLNTSVPITSDTFEVNTGTIDLTVQIPDADNDGTVKTKRKLYIVFRNVCKDGDVRYFGNLDNKELNLDSSRSSAKSIVTNDNGRLPFGKRIPNFVFKGRVFCHPDSNSAFTERARMQILLMDSNMDFGIMREHKFTEGATEETPNLQYYIHSNFPNQWDYVIVTVKFIDVCLYGDIQHFMDSTLEEYDVSSVIV